MEVIQLTNLMSGSWSWLSAKQKSVAGDGVLGPRLFREHVASESIAGVSYQEGKEGLRKNRVLNLLSPEQSGHLEQ